MTFNPLDLYATKGRRWELTMKSALVLIDIQNDYFPGGKNELFHAEQAASCARKVLSLYRDNELPIFFIQHIEDNPEGAFFLKNSSGAQIHPCVAPKADERIIIKHTPSSFLNTTLLEELQEQNITHLVFVGMMSHMCVDTTVRAAFNLGFINTVLEDACTTCDMVWKNQQIPAETVHNVFMGSLNKVFAKVISTNEFLSKENLY